ncbi:MAG: shikimate kinase [Lachnospiraceae bacterium]|nr:shikimate kinase [Lachnospiraceae bacterium]
MSRNIFLIGFMGAGKSTIARTLCDLYEMKLVEMDEQIEAQEGRSISRIFSESGEAYFRSLETELLEDLEQMTNMVVSCGGGAAMREENIAIMRKSGSVIYLSAEPETIYDRVKNAHTRPLLEGHMDIAYIEELMAERHPKYQNAADFAVKTDGRNTGDICKEIIEKTRVTAKNVDTVSGHTN